MPNGEIKVASNRTRVWARINLDVTVAYGTDVDRATEVVNDVGDGDGGGPGLARRIVLEAPRVERVEALGEYGITLKVLGQVRATEQPAASGELRRRLLLAFATPRHRDPDAAARRARARRRAGPVRSPAAAPSRARPRTTSSAGGD